MYSVFLLVSTTHLLIPDHAFCDISLFDRSHVNIITASFFPIHEFHLSRSNIIPLAVISLYFSLLSHGGFYQNESQSKKKMLNRIILVHFNITGSPTQATIAGISKNCSCCSNSYFYSTREKNLSF